MKNILAIIYVLKTAEENVFLTRFLAYFLVFLGDCVNIYFSSGNFQYETIVIFFFYSIYYNLLTQNMIFYYFNLKNKLNISKNGLHEKRFNSENFEIDIES